jgi:hypothetical protein
MPSTREGSPTSLLSKGINSHINSRSPSESKGYALPRDLISYSGSVASVAVTSASPSEFGELQSSPPRVDHNGYEESSHRVSLSPGQAREQHRRARQEEFESLVVHLQNELEHNYQIQKNFRTTKFLHATGGGHEQDREFHRQKEDLERTKFVVYKNGQVSKFINDYKGGRFVGAGDKIVASYVNAAPAVAAAHTHRPVTNGASKIVPLHKHFDSASVSSSSDPFKVLHDFPPPPPRSNRGRTITSSNGIQGPSSLSSVAMPTSNSGAPASAYSSVNGSDINPPEATSAITPGTTTEGSVAIPTEAPLTREQVVKAFSTVWEMVEAAESQIKVMRGEIAHLNDTITALTGGSSFDDLTSRVATMEATLKTIVNGRPLESDTAFVANLEVEVKLLRQEIIRLENNTVTVRDSQNANSLTALTFNNKCGLIEKTLGIDITTTGPKPHNVLEGLHSRLWALEEYLSEEHANSRAGQPYRTHNEFVKTTLGRGNAVVNFSATPGYGAGIGSNDLNGGAAPFQGGPIGGSNNDFASAFNRLNLGEDHHFDRHAAPGLAGLNTQLAKIPDHLADMKFDPMDIRYRGNSISTANNNDNRFCGNSTNAVIHCHQHNSENEDHAAGHSRRMSSSALLPGGLVVSDDSKRAKYELKSPPRRHRGGSSGRNSFSVGTPRKSISHSRGNSAAPVTNAQNATTGAIAPPTPTPKKTNDKAYTSWVNQRPGDFLGKKLTGLGQKE